MDEEGRTRLSMVLDPVLYNKFIRVTPWGSRSDVVRALLEEYLRTVGERGPNALIELLSGKLHLAGPSSQILTATNGEGDENSKGLG